MGHFVRQTRTETMTGGTILWPDSVDLITFCFLFKHSFLFILCVFHTMNLNSTHFFVPSCLPLQPHTSRKIKFMRKKKRGKISLVMEAVV